MHEISRILTALGLVVASTGVVVYGMGASYWTPSDQDLTLGLWMMILGVIAAVIGAVMYARTWVEED